MRLSRELINHIAATMADNLESKGLVKYGVPKSQIAEKIGDVIISNMLEEDRLNKDVEKMLAAHESEIAKGNMDYRKVFELAKQKLAKDRGIVL